MLTSSEIEQYHRDGYVTPSFRLDEAILTTFVKPTPGLSIATRNSVTTVRRCWLMTRGFSLSLGGQN